MKIYSPDLSGDLAEHRDRGVYFFSFPTDGIIWLRPGCAEAEPRKGVNCAKEFGEIDDGGAVGGRWMEAYSQ